MLNAKFFDESSVLITGGSGSLGRALSKRLLELDISRLSLLARKWQDLRDASEWLNDCRVRTFIGDVRDLERLISAFRGINIVVHAAAIKDIVSCQYDSDECIKTNVLGTLNVLRAAIICNVKKVIVISSDKASSPATTYGASKNLAESLTVSFQSHCPSTTTFCVARYGNVFGSSGSIVPIFLENKANNVPFSITDLNMTRFWISMTDAVQFVLNCIVDGDRGEIIIPKLKSSTLLSVCQAIAENHPKIIVGMRPGEKLHESLISLDESNHVTDLGWAFCLYPEFTFWTKDYKPRGFPLPAGFTLNSQTADKLSKDELVALLYRV